MAEFQVGLSGCGGGLESVSTPQLLELAEYCEELGYAGLWINEEHFQGSFIEAEGRRCLSPIVLASAMLARTRRLRVGFSVLLLPLHHPVRLAEEIATLDVLSNGRVDLGISRGANPRYLEAFGVDPGSITIRFKETLAKMLCCWQPAAMELGTHKLSVQPKPVQQPHPPIFVGTFTDDTVAWAAKSGYSLICHGIAKLAFAHHLLAVFSAAGGDVGKVPFGRFVYVSESDGRARDELWPTILKLTARLKFILANRNPRFIGERDLEPETFYREMVIAGSPETCSRRIVELRCKLGINYLNVLGAFFGFLPIDLLKRSLYLLAVETLPRVKQASLSCVEVSVGDKGEGK